MVGNIKVKAYHSYVISYRLEVMSVLVASKVFISRCVLSLQRGYPSARLKQLIRIVSNHLII